MRSTTRPALLALLIAPLACGPSDPAPASSSRAAIVGGTVDDGDPGVVSLMVANWPFCSGTLVSPNAVLTAGHCANLIGPSDQYAVAFGTDATHPTRKIKVDLQLTHPQYTAEGAPYDFALLQLDSAVTDVAPAVLGTTALTLADLGAPIRHVGYGVSDEVDGTGSGTKRQATYPITEVDPLVVWSVGPGMQTCTGDSGGPGFVTRGGAEELAAVVSDGPNCHDAGWDGRVDIAAPWIQSTVAAWTPDAGPAVVDAGPDAGSGSTGSGGCGSASGLELLALAAALGMLALRVRATGAPTES